MLTLYRRIPSLPFWARVYDCLETRSILEIFLSEKCLSPSSRGGKLIRVTFRIPIRIPSGLPGKQTFHEPSVWWPVSTTLRVGRRQPQYCDTWNLKFAMIYIALLGCVGIDRAKAFWDCSGGVMTLIGRRGKVASLLSCILRYFKGYIRSVTEMDI